jgi:integrase
VAEIEKGGIMGYKWTNTDIKGLRYRVHPTRTRKKGIRNERDIYFVYRRTLNGRRIEEGLGWLFQGMTLEKAIAKVHELNENARLGEGPVTLAEAQRIAEQERQAAEQQAAAEARARITFSDVWKQYFFQAKADRGEDALVREESIFNRHIKPVLGNRAMPEIAAIHLEKIKANMSKAGLAPRTIQYTLAIVRQVFNFARRCDMYVGDNPVGKVRMPKFDNRRTRFLTLEEADRLLDELAKVSTETHAHALISLHAGMRAGEIWNLTWGDVDLERGILTLRDTKNGRTRPAYTTESVKGMLKARRSAQADPSALVFPGRGGVRIKQASETFNRIVAKLGLNDGVVDPRGKVTFHTLRHTFASWLVENGTDLYVVKELLGHSDFKMTSRYAHLGSNSLQTAVKVLDQALSRGRPEETSTVLKMRPNAG